MNMHILKGAKPADLPVATADEVRMAVNLKTVRRSALTVPLTLVPAPTR